MNERLLKVFMLVTDVGFIAYWSITAAHLIPADLLFKDYSNALMVHWNWSFLPLDILISITGLSSLMFLRRRSPTWRPLAIISLTLTSVSGLQAIAFWTISRDFDVWWWIPNLFLLVYPLFFLPRLVKAGGKA